MPNICQKPNWVVLKSTQLTISLKLKAEQLEYALQSADRPKPNCHASSKNLKILRYIMTLNSCG